MLISAVLTESFRLLSLSTFIVINKFRVLRSNWHLVLFKAHEESFPVDAFVFTNLQHPVKCLIRGRRGYALANISLALSVEACLITYLACFSECEHQVTYVVINLYIQKSCGGNAWRKQQERSAWEHFSIDLS